MKCILTHEKPTKNELEIILVKSMKALSSNIKKTLKSVRFSASNNEIVFLNNSCYVAVESFKGESLKIALSATIQKINSSNFENISLNLVQQNKELALNDILEGFVLGGYIFDKYKSEKKENNKTIQIVTADSKKEQERLTQEFENSMSILKSVNMVRDIVNTPPEDYYPKIMAKDAKEIASKNSIECKVFGEEYLEKHNMNAMLAVGRASRHESKLIHLSYKPKNPKGKIVIVGKGLTYDCGGLSLKETGGLSMKCDKSGGSAVLGILNAISQIHCEYEIHGIVGAVENMIGGDAYKPDDVLYARNGKTIEVRNTDAEGRLVLADCLCYAQDEIEDIDYIFDMATLTGACIIALGEYTTGVMGHSDKMKKRLQKSADNTGELMGILPYNRYLPKKIKSNIADIANTSSSKAGGAITASLFLDNFIEKKYKKKWLHLDIAGAAYREESWGYNPYGGTGAGVRLLVDFIKKLK